MIKFVKCNNCGKVLLIMVGFTESMKCPDCGENSWNLNVNIVDKLSISGMVRLKQRHKPKTKPFKEIKEGDELFRKTGELHHVERIADRENDLYSEIVTDPETGEIIKINQEPLSEHLGHGADDKNKNAIEQPPELQNPSI